MALTEAGATALAAGISATASTGAAIAGGKANRRGVKLAHDQMNWQTQEREASQQWTLDQWNRENEYNSPAAQAARLIAAGFSPLAALDGAGGTTTMPSAPSDPSPASMPQLQNPVAAGAASANQAAASFLEYIKLKNETQKVQNDTDRTRSDVDYKAALTTTEDQLRAGRLDFLGVNIEVGKSQYRLNDQKVRESAQVVEESKQRIQEMIQYMHESGVRVSVMEWQKYAQQKQLPYQIRLLGAQICLANQEANLASKQAHNAWYNGEYMKSLTTGQNMQNKMTAYYMKNYSKQTMKLQFDQLMGSTKSRMLYTIDKGMSTVSNTIAPLVDFFQGFMFWRLGASKMISPASVVNPIGFGH